MLNSFPLQKSEHQSVESTNHFAKKICFLTQKRQRQVGGWRSKGKYQCKIAEKSFSTFFLIFTAFVNFFSKFCSFGHSRGCCLQFQGAKRFWTQAKMGECSRQQCPKCTQNKKKQLWLRAAAPPPIVSEFLPHYLSPCHENPCTSSISTPSHLCPKSRLKFKKRRRDKNSCAYCEIFPWVMVPLKTQSHPQDPHSNEPLKKNNNDNVRPIHFDLNSPTLISILLLFSVSC